MAKKWDLRKLEEIVELFTKTKNVSPDRLKVANELTTTIKEIKAIKELKTIEKLAEVEYQTIGKMRGNLAEMWGNHPSNPIFSKDKVLLEVKRFEKWEQKHFWDKDFQFNSGKYFSEFLDMLESHWINTKNIKTIEDIIKIF